MRGESGIRVQPECKVQGTPPHARGNTLVPAMIHLRYPYLVATFLNGCFHFTLQYLITQFVVLGEENFHFYHNKDVFVYFEND